MEFKTFVAVFSFIVTLTSGQLHPDDTSLTCFRCDDNNRDNFPMCLQTPLQCKPGDVCKIRYGWGTDHHIPHIYCSHPSRCQRDLIGHPIQCADGGQQLDNDICELCCETSDCVTNMTDFLRVGVMSSGNLYCPGRCNLDSLENCINTGRVCHKTQFCQVKIDHANRITGACIDDHSLLTCENNLRAHPCPDDFTNKTAYDSTNSVHCRHGCCTTNKCLYPHFGLHMAKTVVPDSDTLIPVSDTNTTVNGEPNSLWDQFRGSCKDSLETTFCESLRDHHDLCHDRRAVGICPQTCGICDSVNSQVCKDTTGLCAELVDVNPGFCNGDESVFQCPATCGHCDKLLESIVLSVLNGTAPAQGTGVVTMPAGDTTPSPVNCSTLSQDDCVHIGPLCETSFLGVVCPDVCAVCTQGAPAA